MKTVLTATLCVALLVATIVGITLDAVATVFLSFIIPIIMFLSTYWLVTGLGKKIILQMRKAFGENVVRIVSAIIEYFEVPLTIILTACLTLFILAISAVVILLPRLEMLGR